MAAWALGPVSYVDTMSSAAKTWFLAGVAAMGAGIIVGLCVRVAGAQAEPLPDARRRQVLRVLVIGAWGALLLRYADLLGRGYLEYGGATEYRLAEQGLGGNLSPIGMVSATLFPLTVVAAVVIVLLCPKGSEGRNIWLTHGALLAAGFAAYGMLRGGRTHLVLLLLFLVICTGARVLRLAFGSAGHAAASVVTVLAAVLYSASLLIDRNRLQGFSDFGALQYLQTAHGAIPDPWVMRVAAQSDAAASVLYPFVSTSHYFVHGVFEYGSVYEHQRQAAAGYGGVQFPYLQGVLDTFGLGDAPNAVPVRGVYTTFFGSSYADFGNAALAWAFAIGLVCGVAYRFGERGSVMGRLVFGLSGSIIVLAPFYNGVQIGGTVFLIVAVMLAWPLLRRLRAQPPAAHRLEHEARGGKFAGYGRAAPRREPDPAGHPWSGTDERTLVGDRPVTVRGAPLPTS